MSIKLDQNEAILISDLTFKLFYNIRRQLITKNKQPTNLLKHAKQCQRIYQGFKDLVYMKVASKRYIEKSAAVIATTRMTTTQTMSFANPNNQPAISKKNQLMKEKDAFCAKK